MPQAHVILSVLTDILGKLFWCTIIYLYIGIVGKALIDYYFNKREEYYKLYEKMGELEALNRLKILEHIKKEGNVN